MHPFYNFLTQLSENQLPGEAAQVKLLPRPRGQEIIRPLFSDKGGYPSAVLIPLYPGPDEKDLNVILTLRAKKIRHAGQISFPGGRKEGNESLECTALRETHEEIGIDPDLIRIARPITPLYLERTNHQIQPFVGFLKERPSMKREPDEVEEVITLPLDQLRDKKFKKRETWDLNKVSFTVPFWDIHPIPLWGATAMIMSELLDLYTTFLMNQKHL
ncbi:MAG TPA: CoA pyrophosphatase [Balneolaceae bacterium]|nr:CoA pyrophosphatase [Balneolaceae bacterium]